MRHPLLVPDLRELIHDGEVAGLRDFFADHHPGRVAELIEDLETDDGDALFRILPPRNRAEVLSYLDHDRQVRLVEAMPPKEAAELLHVMSHDERADLVNRLDEDVVDPVLPFLAQAEREDIRRLASYEPGTAGAVMTTDYVTLPPHITVREALERIRHEAPDRETIYYCYVVDHKRRLIGFVSLKRLILSRRSAVIEDIMQRDVIFARVDEDQEAVARQIDKYDLIAIPVVDASDMLVGIITHDDAMDILRQEQTEDILAFGGVSRDAEANEETYWQGPDRRGRPPPDRLAAPAVPRRHDHQVRLALLQGGPARASRPDRLHPAPDRHRRQRRQPDRRHDHPRPGARRDPGLADVPRVCSASGSPACCWGSSSAASASSYTWFLHGNPAFAAVIALAILFICMWANSVGALVPLLAKRFGIDPAVVSAPLISTLVDATGLVIFYTVAIVAPDQAGGSGGAVTAP